MDNDLGGTIFDRLRNLGYSEAAALTDPAAFLTVVKSRRSIRIFNSDPVPEAVMRECLKAATLAPNSSNLQPWEFYWVRTPEKKRELVKFCLNQPAARTAAELVVCVARIDTWQRNREWMVEKFAQSKSLGAPREYYERIVPLAYGRGPLGLFGFIKRIGMGISRWFKVTPGVPCSKADMRIWAIKSTALACENLMLALRAHGFDSCPMEGFDPSRVKKLLKLGSSADVVMVVSAGRRREDAVYGPRFRFSDSEFIIEV